MSETKKIDPVSILLAPVRAVRFLARGLRKAGSVFELICKVLIMTVIIPWGSIFLNGLVFDRLLHLVNKSDVWPYVILGIAALLELAGLFNSVLGIREFVKSRKGPRNESRRKQR